MPRRRLAMVAAGALVAGLVIAAAATWTLMRPALTKLQPMRFALVQPAAQALAMQGFDRDLAISADNTHLVYVGGNEAQVMVRAIDQLEAVPLRGTTGARHPFLSPDGRWVGFFTGLDGEIKKVSISGGPPISLCPISGTPRGASWGPDNTIIFATNDPSSGLLRVSAAGGPPTVLTTPDAAHGELDHFFPSVLPNGRAVLFTITTTASIDTAQVAALDLTTGRYKTLIQGGSQAEYLAPSTGSGQDGYLVYAVSGTLRAVRFDPVKLDVLSDPVPAIESVATLPDGAAEFSVSRQGALVYIPGGAIVGTRSLVWVNRQGHEESIAGTPRRAYVVPRLSPDGTRVAVYIADQALDIWVWDLARQTLTRLTDSPAADQNPMWTPDGKRVIFTSSRSGVANLFWQAADNTGTAERLTTSPNAQAPMSISPDGTRLIVREIAPKTGVDLRVLRLDGTSPRQTEPLVQTTFTEDNGEISPDGHWLAYQSNESGQFQVFVRPFPNIDGGGRWTISPNGGSRPLWARSGKELFYLDGANAVTAVPVQTTSTFSAGNPTKLFDGLYFIGGTARAYDVSLDDQKFLMIKANAGGDQTSTSPIMVVVLNWFTELQQRVPTR